MRVKRTTVAMGRPMAIIQKIEAMVARLPGSLPISVGRAAAVETPRMTKHSLAPKIRERSS